MKKHPVLVAASMVLIVWVASSSCLYAGRIGMLWQVLNHDVTMSVLGGATITCLVIVLLSQIRRASK